MPRKQPKPTCGIAVFYVSRTCSADFVRCNRRDAPQPARTSFTSSARGKSSERARGARVDRMSSGYLLKQNHSGRRWDRRYFQLQGPELSYWRDASLSSAVVKLSLSGSKLSQSTEKARAGRWPFVVELSAAAHPKGWSHITLTGETQEDTAKWVDAIKKVGVESTHEGLSAYRPTTASAHTHAASPRPRRVRFGSETYQLSRPAVLMALLRGPAGIISPRWTLQPGWILPRHRLQHPPQKETRWRPTLRG